MTTEQASTRIFAAGDLHTLIAALRDRCYRVVGPVVDQQAVVLAEIGSADRLPAGWGDEQDGGCFRLVPRDDGATCRWSKAR